MFTEIIFLRRWVLSLVHVWFSVNVDMGQRDHHRLCKSNLMLVTLNLQTVIGSLIPLFYNDATDPTSMFGLV